jgi:hypothetical protein
MGKNERLGRSIYGPTLPIDTAPFRDSHGVNSSLLSANNFKNGVDFSDTHT